MSLLLQLIILSFHSGYPLQLINRMSLLTISSNDAPLLDLICPPITGRSRSLSTNEMGEIGNLPEQTRNRGNEVG